MLRPDIFDSLVISMVRIRYFLTLLMLTFSNKACASTRGWFAYTLLANPGLNSSTVTSVDACISSCASSDACSAISYQHSTQTCVYSYCANLYLVKNTGWNTYVLYTILVENFDYPAPQFEWMLTQTCGFANTGNVSSIPAMSVASGAGYLPGPTAYQGNAVYLSPSVSTSSATIYTATSSSMNCNYVPSGFTVGIWFNFDASSIDVILFRHFNLVSGTADGGYELALYMAGSLHSGVPGGYRDKLYTAPTNVWTHFAMVYDASSATLTTYVNASQFSVQSVSKIVSAPECNMVAMGTRPGTWGQLIGRAFCSRVFFSALDSVHVQVMADSCLRGRMRFA